MHQSVRNSHTSVLDGESSFVEKSESGCIGTTANSLASHFVRLDIDVDVRGV